MQWDASNKCEQEAAEAKEEHDVERGVPKEGLDLQQGKNFCPSKEVPPCNSDDGAVGFLSLVFKFPRLLIAPSILFCLIVALCIFGIVHATHASYDMEGQRGRDAALSAADGLAKQLTSATRAALSLAAVVKMNPNWSFLESNFHVLAEELFRQSNDGGSLALMELILLPFGRVRANMGKPTQRNTTADIFSPGLVDEYVPYKSMEQDGLLIKGPFPLTNSEAHAFSAGYPIFFNDTDEDESWGHPDNITHPTSCPGPPCYNPKTREKFWGFAGVLINAGPILAGNNVHLDRLLADDLSYLLTVDPPNGTSRGGTFVRGGAHPDKVTANVTVSLPGNSWALSVYNPRQDEILTLRDGLIAMVVVVAFILSVLLLLLLLSAKRASVLLKEQLVTNKLLQEEKVSREALLGRQFDLIACLEETTKRIKMRSKSKLTPGQLNTLDRIDEARAAISDVRHGNEEDINIQELLAEGSFGKVYRGQWRGTDVAVKVIMLPKNMSGREKREKMVVWEAAISSSLIHPNICQTYHYRIKPVKESARPSQKMANVGSPVASSDMSGSRPKSSIQTDSENNSGSTVPEEVHSYEVHLVLEYCDRLSLRDALDAGSFMTPTGLNYAAQLDCAMDIARAMLHLHCNNVLHLDLKTRNILLSSSGAEGKGVICKVSDFGLSVRMDFSETHVSSLFQGTMTHMSPEVMLKGTCSKASDVYAFGIVLWELYTGDSPFRDVPPVLLGHSIVKDGKRPTWPASVPRGYRDLAKACWDQNPDARPTFEVILEVLRKLRKELGIPTPPLKPYSVHCPQSKHPHVQETFGSLSQPSLTQMQSQDGSGLHQAQGPTTPSQAEILLEAWLRPRGYKDNPRAEAPSTPYQAEPHHLKVASAPSDALSHASMEVCGLTDQEKSSSASLVKEGEGKTGSTSLAHEKAGQGGLNHPQSSAQKGGNEHSRHSSMPGPPMLGSLTTSTHSTPPDKPPLGTMACSLSPWPAPHAVVPCTSRDSRGVSSCGKGDVSFCHADSHGNSCCGKGDVSFRHAGSRGNSSCSKGDCHVRFHLSCDGPSHSGRDMGKGDAGEPLASGAEGGSERRTNHHKGADETHGAGCQQEAGQRGLTRPQSGTWERGTHHPGDPNVCISSQHASQPESSDFATQGQSSKAIIPTVLPTVVHR